MQINHSFQKSFAQHQKRVLWPNQFSLHTPLRQLTAGFTRRPLRYVSGVRITKKFLSGPLAKLAEVCGAGFMQLSGAGASEQGQRLLPQLMRHWSSKPVQFNTFIIYITLCNTNSWKRKLFSKFFNQFMRTVWSRCQKADVMNMFYNNNNKQICIAP